MASQDADLNQRSFKRRRNPNHQALVKYRPRSKNANGTDQTVSRMKPSMMVSQVLGKGFNGNDDSDQVKDSPPPPRILEFLNMEDNTLQVRSAVPIDEPLFQVHPTILRFDDYDPFGVYERVISFRNNDRVARRLRVSSPDTPFFDVLGPRSPGKLMEMQQSKIAPGMEVCYVVRFKPQEVRDYYLDLVCITEREKFVVPVHALGKRAVLDFPDEVDFGVAAVKSTTCKTFIVRNIGTCTAKFILSCSRAVFSASPVEGSLAVGQSMLVELTFTPNFVMSHSGDLVIEYENGQQVFVALTGVAENVDVMLGSPTLFLEPAYITLSSQKTVKIYNRSDLPVKFEWRAFATAQEEEEERSRLHAELDRMESLEETQLMEGHLALRVPSSSSSMRKSKGEHQRSDTLLDSSSDSDGVAPTGGQKFPPALRALQAALRRKYRHLRRALEEDNMLFADEVFEILPLTGEIWANSEIEVTVKFRANTAADFSCQAFLEVVGREQRLGLILHGQGIGPKASLSYDVLDIGDLFVNSLHKYEITLMNKGDIPTDWELIPSRSPMGDKFKFEPSAGRLGVGEAQTLAIRFQSGILGEFAENFHVALRGSEDLLTCQFKGQVIGPTFHFDKEEIDYGTVSYDFLQSRSVVLFNTSDIPMVYSLRIPQDGTYIKREFNITPNQGVLQPGEQQIIQVDLQSSTVKAYEYYLSVDVEGAGQALLSLPLKAVCKVPPVKLLKKELNYGECFIRYPYDQTFTLVNESPNLFAKFHIVAQEAQTQSVALYQPLPPDGEIPPSGQAVVTLRLSCEKLGGFRLPLTIEIPGSVEPPLQAAIVASSVGPRIELDQAALNWGATVCLFDSPRPLTITNVSLIPAPFKTFIKNARSKFRVDVREGILGPQESLKLIVIANLDDIIAHTDDLHIIVKEGDSVTVPLSARGTGTTMFSTTDMRVVDFGYQFTNHICEKKITLENKGRRQQVLKWSNKTIKDKIAEKERAERNRKQKDDPGLAANRNKKEEEIVAVFSVTPEEIELRPRTAIVFTFRGYITACGPISEMLVCESRMGKDKLSKPVFETEVRADFINPLLEFSQKSFSFEHTYVPDVPLELVSQPLTMSNTSHLPITFVLRTQVPFGVDSWEHSLAAGESQTIHIEFDAGYRNDRHSHKVEKQLTVQYNNHPHRDYIPVFGEVNFPNLEFEYSTVNFGCVLNDTSKTMLVRVTNNGKVDTAFHWTFLEDDETLANKATRTAGGDSRKAAIPINQVFDILPIRSYLVPGQSEDIEFIFYGHANRKFKGTAICEVEGGPEYEIGLLGDASNVGFKLDKPFLDFGKVLHTKYEDAELNIVNPGKVTFAYKVRVHLLSQPGILEVTPASGKVPANDKQKILVRFRPGVPQAFKETLVLEIAHFEPVYFLVFGQGIYSSVALSLPRLEPLLPERLIESGSRVPSWSELMDQAHTKLLRPDEGILPPKEGLPPPPQATTASLPVPQHNTPLPSDHSGVGSGADLSKVGSLVSFTSDGRNNQSQSKLVKRQEPAPLEVEMEANRLLYMAYLLEEAAVRKRLHTTSISDDAGKIRQSLDDSVSQSASKQSPKFSRRSSRPSTMNSQASHDTSLSEGGDESRAPSRISRSRKTLSKQKSMTQPPPPPGKDAAGGVGRRRFDLKNIFVIARHLADFGHVVVGQSKKRVFRVTNMSQTGPLSFVFDKNTLAGTGYSIEPEKVVRLPEHESVSFTVTFVAKKQLPLGPKELELPIEIKNGPPTLLILKANVTVPEVTVSVDKLIFGTVFVGNSCTSYIQLHNTSPVAAEWDFKKPMGSTRDETRFLIEPRGGQLSPGGKINVAVEFLPQEERLHHLKIPLRVSNSPKSKSISFEGTGQNVEIIFRPSLAELGPVLPYGAPAECIIEMCNNSDRDVEVFSLDFDTRYSEEEEILSKAKSYAADDMMRLPVRLPGQGLPESVLKEYREALELGDNIPEPDGLVDPTPDWDKRQTVRMEGKAQDVIIVGPPLSGKSTVAYHIGKKYTYPVLTLNTILLDAMKMRSDLGLALRCATLRFASEREATVQAEKMEQLKAQVEAERAEKERALEESSKTKKKNKQQGEVEDKPPSPSPAELELLKMQTTSIDSELLQEAVEWRLQELDCERGAVIDSLNCDFAPPEIAAEAVAKAMPKATLISLGFVSKEQYTERMSRLLDSVKAVPVLKPSTTLAQEPSPSPSIPEARGFSIPSRPGSGIKKATSRVTSLGPPKLISITAEEDDMDEVTLDGVENDHQPLPPFQYLDESELWAMDDKAKLIYERNERAYQHQVSARARRLRKRVHAIWKPTTPRLLEVNVAKLVEDGEEVEEKSQISQMERSQMSSSIQDSTSKEKLFPFSDETIADGLAPAPQSMIDLVLKMDPPPPPPVVTEEAPVAPKPGTAGKNKGTRSKKGLSPSPEPSLEPVVKEKVPPPFTDIYTWTVRLQKILADKFFLAVKDDKYFEEIVSSSESAANESSGQINFGPRPTMIQRKRVLEVDQLGGDSAEGCVAKALQRLPAPIVPPPDPDVLEIPSPKERQLVRRPQRRMVRPPLTSFKIAPMESQNDEGKDADNTENVDSEGIIKVLNRSYTRRSFSMSAYPFRWVVAARDSVHIKVFFSSPAVGRFDTVLGFEVVGCGKRELSLVAVGICDVPTVNSDPRNVFMNRVKSRPEHALPLSKKYVANRSVFEFGPLLTWKTPSVLKANSPRSVDDKQSPYALARATNSEVLRMTNSGKFPALLDFSFEDSDCLTDAPIQLDTKGKPLPVQDKQADVYFVEPKELELAVGETKEVRVWAFPNTAELHSDVLVICVQDNPEPIRFYMTSLGVLPHLELQGPWQAEEPEDDFANTIGSTGFGATSGSVTFQRPKTATRSDRLASVRSDRGEREKLQESADIVGTVDFDRLLLQRSEQREFSIHNPTTIPVVWQLDLAQLAQLEEFRLSPTEGTILPGQTTRVSIFFNSITENVFDHCIKVKYSDQESLFKVDERVQSLSLKVTAEAYSIKAVAFEEDSESNSGEINFGNIRVGEEKVENFKIRNMGKYDITYEFKIRRHSTQQLFLIEPKQGLILPGDSAEISVLFVSDREVRLKDNKDITCHVTEPHTGEVVEEFNVSASVNSYWSTFRLQPARGLNFGALGINEAAPRSRKFELKNQGTFEFVFLVSAEAIDEESLNMVLAHTPPALHPNYKRKEWIFIDPATLVDEDEHAGSRPASATKTASKDKAKVTARKPTTAKSEKDTGRGGKKNDKKQATTERHTNVQNVEEMELPSIPQDSRMIGHFKVMPCGGVVHPGQSISVEVEFHPAGKGNYKEYLAIQVSGANAEEQVYQQALHYELVGESCVPGISTDDWRTIFEEQAIVPSLAEKPGLKSKAAPGAKQDITSSGVFFAEKERLFTFGSVVCSKENKKTNCERFKIFNPNRITAMVDFSVTNLGGSSQDAEGAGKKAAAPSKKQKDAPLVSSEAVVTGDAAAFTVQPSSWEIPPHEPRYVSVYFHPAEMRAYRALFTAKLPQNPDPESSKLEFQLAGKGTLPCITMEKPVGRDESGKVLVDFGSLSLGKSRRNPLIVRNDGIIPVTALFEMELSPHFSFVAKAGSITLEPGDRREMSMQFQPTGPSEKESPYTCQIRMTVLHNQYESTQITLTGECFVNDLAFEFDGDGDFDDDQLDFKQVDLKDGEAFKEERFSLRNNCTEPLRYEFEPHPHFTFTPLSGHIQAGQSKDIKAVFKAAETVKCKDELLKVTSRRIKYLSENLDQAMMEWDSELCEVRPARQDEIDVWKQWQADPRQREITLSPSKEAEKSKKPKPAAKDSKQLSVKNVVQNSYAQLKEVIFNEDGTAMASVGLPEPECNLDVEKVQQIRLNGIADFARFSCESSQIVFRPTAMFQTRVHTFTIQNESLIPIPFTFAMEKNTSAGITRPPTMGGKPVYLPNPFTIDPLAGEIPGEGNEKITIKFSPQEVDDYQYILHCDMPNLPEDQQPLSVYLGGQAVRPIVHFELENDDHYLADRNNALKNELGVPGAIEAASIRVVEVTSKGTRVRNTKRFHVVNPTSATYDFEWVTQGEPSPAWRCQTNKGLILSGRRGEMIFEFTPEDVSISESFFRFKVPSQGLDELFLFVGVVADPHIALDTTRVDFNALMLGQMATETVHLVNHEHLPFAFAFDRMSVLQGMEEESRKRPVLEVNPMTGMVPPDGRTAVEITFCPREEKFHNFNLLCNVRKKPTALSLNVKGEGYAVHCKLQMEDKSASGAGMVDLSKAPSSNVVDFGNVHLNERAVKKIALSNTGKFNFDYIWDRPSNTSPMLQIVGGRMGGSIRKGERVELTVEFHPVSEVVLDGTQLTCTVAGKDDYVLGIFGRGVKPGLQFSFTKFDFGACFLTPPGANPLVEQKMLTVTNRSGSSNLSLTCTFQRDRALDVRCDPTVLEPGLALNIPILFTPREARAYVFSVPFLVNGSYNVNVIILGEGVVARLELANPSHAHINFGSVVEGGEVAKQLRLVNRSKRPLEFQLMDPGAEDGPNKGALHSVDVSFFPIAPTVLVPRASCTIDLRFVPTRRLAPFSEDLMIKYGGMVRKLSALAGQCTGMEVALETDAIPFGVVCMGSQRARKLNFENSGDMPARFKWQESSFGQHFSVTPLEGVVAPMAETSFEVVFRPKAIDDDIRQEGMRLFVEGTSSLALTCTGMCVPQPADTVKELVFNARTRKSQAQSINIKNPTDTPWYLSPILSGEHWSADEELAVPAKSEARFELVYKPKAMTKGGISHEGSIFFALPDGSALLYNLRGTADEPESEGSHTHNAVAKQSLPVQVEVKNWLEMPQKFTVKIEIVDGDPLATFISGTNTIDVPPFGLKGYAMKFYAYKEGTTKVRVSFTNEHSGEYMFHDFRFDTTEPGVLETISLETPVRQHARHLITIDNPLPANIPVSFSDRWWSCTNPYVNLTRLGEISGNSEGVFEVDYRPLLETSTAMDTELNFSCVELGKYKYQLRLKANPPTSMPTLHFEAPLGNTQQETFLFRAFNKAATAFKCSVQQPLFFEVQKSIDVEAALTWDGSDVKVDITFEPERLGEVHDTLVVRSEEGGEYRCALVGVCTPALPQGPFVISNGTSKDIIFRNVFNEARDFQFAVDDSRFVATPVSQNIASKSSKAVSVKFTATGSSSSNIPAKLFISCPSLPEMPPWIFYLQGQD